MLLDTHVLIWALREPERLSPAARRALEAAAVRAISAASLYEITLKATLGKWPEVADLLNRDLDAELRALGFDVIPASGAIMQRAGCYDWAHRDPFDRIIVATAAIHTLPLVSKDATLDAAPEPTLTRIW